MSAIFAVLFAGGILGTLLWVFLISWVAARPRWARYAGSCLKCGYPREGIGDRPCPECNAPAPLQQSDEAISDRLMLGTVLGCITVLLMLITTGAVGFFLFANAAAQSATSYWPWLIGVGLLILFMHAPAAAFLLIARARLPIGDLISVFIGGVLMPQVLHWTLFTLVTPSSFALLIITIILAIAAISAPFGAGLGWFVGGESGSIARSISRADHRA